VLSEELAAASVSSGLLRPVGGPGHQPPGSPTLIRRMIIKEEECCFC
jgi:hypothetical protein